MKKIIFKILKLLFDVGYFIHLCGFFQQYFGGYVLSRLKMSKDM